MSPRPLTGAASLDDQESAVDGIFETTTRVLELAERMGVPTGEAADWLVRKRLGGGADIENTPERPPPSVAPG